MEQIFGDNLPQLADLTDILSSLLDDGSAIAAKRDFRLKTVGDSNEVGDVATAIATVHALIESATTDELDNFAEPYQMDGHRKANYGQLWG